MKLVTTILALFFLVTGFVPRADYAELSKLPTLIQHYQFHQQHEDAAISFFDFLQKHYTDNSSDNDDAAHEELPFQNHEHCAGGLILFTIAQLDFSFIQLKIEDHYNTPKIKYFIGSYFGNIWQPPCLLIG
jgi:hypothetical protein